MERYLRVNLLGPGPRLMKNNLPGRGLTKVEKHCYRVFLLPYTRVDRLCGLVVRVSGYRYRGPGFDPRRYQIF